MNWKDYKVEPEEGMFEKIQHRLRVRRAWRMVGIAAGVVVAAFVVVAILLPKSSDDNMMAVNQTVVADEPTTVQQMPAIEETSQSIVDNRQQTTVNMQPATQESDIKDKHSRRSGMLRSSMRTRRFRMRHRIRRQLWSRRLFNRGS